jgi:hypothetical protein
MSASVSKTAMKRALAGGLGLVCAVSAVWVGPAAAQGVARANEARPDFAPTSGVGWLAAGTEFIAMPTGPHPVTYEKGYRYVPNNTGEQPTFRVADLDNPILQPWVVAALKKVNERALSGKDAFPPQVRCWPLGVPAFVLYPAQPVYFIQTPTEVLMTWQADHMVRRVFLTDKHSANPKPSWFGESIGHYEGGDTLVVDTIGLNTRTFVDNYRTPHTEQMHVVERFKMVDGGKTLQVSVTVDDPGAFNMPWSAIQHWRRINRTPLIEDLCEPENDFFFGYGVAPLPHADKADF